MGKKRKLIPKAESSSSEEEDSESEELEKEEVKEESDDEAGTDEDSDEDEDEESLDPSDHDSIRKLLEPFPKDQLISLLTTACLKNPNLLSRLTASASNDTTHRKLFVHGLGWDATSETLAAVFSSFGPLEDCNAVLDRATGRSKGYGFVTFRSAKSARRALAAENIVVSGHRASCQLASMGPPSSVDNAGRSKVPSNAANSVALPVLQADDLALPAYAPQSLLGFGPVAGLVNQGLLGPNAGMGLLGSGLVGAVVPSYGVGLGLGGPAVGVSSLSPSLIGPYASQAALQGVGSYDSGQWSSVATTRSQGGVGALGSGGLTQHYLGR